MAKTKIIDRHGKKSNSMTVRLFLINAEFASRVF